MTKFQLALLSILLTPSYALRANSWQKRLDRALLDVDGGGPESRIRNLQRALGDRYFRKDVTKAFKVVQDKGFGKGHPEFIDILWPRGTFARSDIEGLQGFVTKQLPERWEEIQAYGTNDLNDLRNSVSSPEPNAVLSSLVDSLRDRPERVVTLAQNALRSTPLEVETPSYEVLKAIVGDENAGTVLTEPTVEVRRYDAYRAASCEVKSNSYSLDNMGAGLNRLFSYMVLGENADKQIMEMTAPFSMQSTGYGTTMSVKLPSRYAESAPEPSIDSTVRIMEVPETTTATLSFPGICTNAEIERQTEALLRGLEKDGTFEVVSRSSVAVLQYNAPGTMPWRRKNEIGVPVVEKRAEQIDETEVGIVSADDEQELLNDIVAEAVEVEKEEPNDVVAEAVEAEKEEPNDIIVETVEVEKEESTDIVVESEDEEEFM